MGSHGLLGKGLVARLAEDPAVDRIVAIDLRPPEHLPPKVHFHRIDLTRPSADQEIADVLVVERTEAIVHLAFFGEAIPNASYAHELEVIGTLHVLTAATAAKVPRLVMRSTTAVYGAHPKNPSLIREDQRPRGAPGSRFVSDKLEAEKQVRRYAEEHPEAAVSILRFAPILGPGARNLFSRYLSGGVAPTLAGFDPLMQAVHPDDAVDALLLTLQSDAAGIFNIAGPGVIPISAALRLRGTRAIPLPHRLAEGALRAMRGMGLGYALPASMLDFLRYPVVTDFTLAQRTLGFHPRHGTLDAVQSIDVGAGAGAEAR
ncbi:MAG TPA: NAD-dependent epimerase/dehydratase family protein [Vulgatibacter sp.]